jgi:hypothetical protein
MNLVWASLQRMGSPNFAWQNFKVLGRVFTSLDEKDKEALIVDFAPAVVDGTSTLKGQFDLKI